MVANLQGNLVLNARKDPYGVAGMRTLGRGLGAKWVQINGAQTFGYAHYDAEPVDAVLWSVLTTLTARTWGRIGSSATPVDLLVDRVSVVPEPASIALLAAGVAVVALRRRRAR